MFSKDTAMNARRTARWLALCVCLVAALIGYSFGFGDPCERSPCKHGGICRTDWTGGNVICHCGGTGYTGRLCENDLNECKEDSCLNPISCENYIGGFDCVCNVGWSEPYCNTTELVCDSNPCQGNATCVDTRDSFACDCKLPYKSKYDCNEISESPICNEDRCLVHHYCEERRGTFVCKCPPGFMGPQCQQGKDECLSNPCFYNGTCIDMHMGFTCLCIEGLTGPVCNDDYNECEDSKYCHHPLNCSNWFQGYFCYCYPGYTGGSCQYVEEMCSSNPCPGESLCSLDSVSHACSCDGWFQAGEFCEQNITECSTQWCVDYGVCEHLHTIYVCECKDGFAGDDCSMESRCTSNPCMGTGRCIPEEKSFRCECPTGLLGHNCENDTIDECDSNPCLNYGVCLDRVLGFKCLCEPGFEDYMCQRKAGKCNKNVCQNLGLCSNYSTKVTCKCRKGFTGPVCETNIDECASNPCRGTAMCRDGDNEYNCVAHIGQGTDTIVEEIILREDRNETITQIVTKIIHFRQTPAPQEVADARRQSDQEDRIVSLFLAITGGAALVVAAAFALVAIKDHAAEKDPSKGDEAKKLSSMQDLDDVDDGEPPEDEFEM